MTARKEKARTARERDLMAVLAHGRRKRCTRGRCDRYDAVSSRCPATRRARRRPPVRGDAGHEGAALNTRADDLEVALRGILGMLPGADSISIHIFRAWAYILITASTEAAVRTLGHDLDLGAPEIRAAQRTWWLRAMSELRRGTLRIEVVGPHHQWPPPAR
jgi:hypothetical protein